jgi:chaperonin GroEL (HSP60 family)
MSNKKVKSTAKLFISDTKKIRSIVTSTMEKIADAVGSTLGPNGRVSLIESEYYGIPNKNTKDGVTVFKSLGARDPFEHIIIEQIRDAATKTASEAGDGPQDLDSKIFTPNGPVRMGDIKVGMEICGTNGTVQKVMGVFPKGQKEIYEIELSGGKVVKCCKNHLWTVSTHQKFNFTVPLFELMKDFSKPNPDRTTTYKYYVQTTEVFFKEEKEKMPLDPYLVGLLIGDGSLSGTEDVELSLGLKKEHILDKILLPEGLYVKTTFVKNKKYFRVKIQGKTKDGKTISDFLKELGLYGTDSHTKFIPQPYLYSSLESRKRLLQGMIDTDGYLKPKGCFEINTVSERLGNEIASLGRSLGYQMVLRVRKNKGKGSYSQTPIYRVVKNKGYKHGSKIVDIRPTGKFTEMQCIKVSGKDNLYITDNFVVTHNTTSATILATSLTKNLLDFCDREGKMSPQKAVRSINKILKKQIIPYIKEQSIPITVDNTDLLFRVAKVSANGDDEMAKAVIEAFEQTGMTENSHVTIQELSGAGGYKVSLVEGFPVAMGYEDSIGKFHTAFINDQGNLRCVLDQPIFILFDGQITDLIQFEGLIENLSVMYQNGSLQSPNIVLVAHGFSESVITSLAINFPAPSTLNIVPFVTPMDQMKNSKYNFLLDLASFTGASVFGMHRNLREAFEVDENGATFLNMKNFGSNMERIEIYRFKTTVVGNPDQMDIESRVEILQNQLENPESLYAEEILKERIGKLTSGIARLEVYAGSSGELKEKHDRVEDAVCAVRAAIAHGALPGGGRILTNLAMSLFSSKQANEVDEKIAKEVIAPTLLAPLHKLLDNAGYSQEEISNTLDKLMDDKDLVLDVENDEFGNFMEMGIFDATKAVEEAIKNAVSIASVMGVLGSIVVFPRDETLERAEAAEEMEFRRTVEAPHLALKDNEERW